jgi:inhibitor of the pro-sigma K processing machinery
MEYAVYFLVAVLAILIVVKFFAWPLKVLIRLLLNAVLGVVLLLVTNYFGAYFNIAIGINAVTVIVAGFFGVPGVIFLIIFKTMM